LVALVDLTVYESNAQQVFPRPSVARGKRILLCLENKKTRCGGNSFAQHIQAVIPFFSQLTALDGIDPF
jgi:hypothetical protein